MKNKIAWLLILTAFLGCFFGACGREKVMTLDRQSVDEDLYRYWLCSFKSYFLRNYADIEDTEECWNKEMTEGQTVGEYVEQFTLEYAENALCALRLYRSRGLVLPASEKQRIDDYIEEVINYRYNGSRSAWIAALKETYGISPDTVKKAYEIEAKIEQLRFDLFANEYAVTDEKLDAYYRENYLRIRFIYFNSEYRYIRNEDGTYQTDPDTGYYKTEPLSETERQAKLDAANEALRRLQNGESFSDVAGAYSDWKGSVDSENGYYLSKADYSELTEGGYSPDILLRIMAMKPGEMAVFTDRNMESDYPGTFLVACLPLAEKPYLSDDRETAAQFDDLKTAVENQIFNDLLSEMAKDIVFNESLLSVYKIQNVNTGLSYLNG